MSELSICFKMKENQDSAIPLRIAIKKNIKVSDFQTTMTFPERSYIFSHKKKNLQVSPQRSKNIHGRQLSTLDLILDIGALYLGPIFHIAYYDISCKNLSS